MILKAAYLIFSLVMTMILIYIGFFAINKSVIQPKKGKQYKITLVVTLLLWHIYLFFISNSGILADFSFPPRLPLLIIIPLFTFSGIFVYKNRKKVWVQSIPTPWLTYYQSLRIGIETLFYFSIPAGILPALVTFEGYNYDIFFGFSALIIGYLVFFKKSLNFNHLIYWNIAGLIIIAFIIFLFVTGTYFPTFYSDQSNTLTPAFTEYPYILVAGFLMPSAVFIHLLSLAQLKFKK